MRLSRDKYMLLENSRSNSNSWLLVNAVRILFELPESVSLSPFSRSESSATAQSVRKKKQKRKMPFFKCIGHITR